VILPPRILALIREQERLLERGDPKHLEAILAVAKRAAAELEDRLKALAPGRWTTTETRTRLAQLKVIVELIGARIGERMGDAVRDIYEAGAAAGRESLVRQLEAWDAEGLHASTGAVDVASDLLDEGLLEMHETSVVTYGMDAIKAMRQELARGALAGETLPVTWSRLAQAVEIPEWRAERIARTEHSFALHRRQVEDLREMFGDQVDELWRKQLVATFDDRTGDDSKFVHGQTRRLDELFEDNEGRRYEHPPNRPNDRETVVFVPAEAEAPLPSYASSGMVSGPAFEPEKLERIVRALKKMRVEVDQSRSGEEWLRQLKSGARYQPGNGRPGEVVWKRKPSRLEVVEELIHIGQHRKRGWRRPSRKEMMRDEIAAQRLLLRVAARKGWTEHEVGQIKANLDDWIAQLQELEEATR